ncbi:MAG: hotdog domain-containing protein, partial [Pyrobaculum sp.]
SVSSFVAMPEDSLDGVLMYAGRLMFKLDELAFIEAFRFKPAIYVTAGVYKIVFKKPIHVGDVVDIKTAISYVGNTSLDVEFFVEAGGFRERRAVAHGFFTFVNMTEGKPTPIGVAIPVDEAAKKRREESVQEAKLLKNLKPPADFDKPWTLQLYRSPS